ncbi:MAG: hypothetical protein IKZ53_03475 [Selenomonadaceae bacterium]|nr:hypothetical protein [Selenomonadaceae bacterium]
MTVNEHHVFFMAMAFWLYQREHGLPIGVPKEIAKNKAARREYKRMLKYFEEIYEREGAYYMEQVLAEAKEKGLVCLECEPGHML